MPECTAEAPGDANGGGGGGGEGAGAGTGQALQWEECGPGMIDMELLTRQEPILFYKHLILFEDFLHDNGVAQLRSGRVLHLPPALSLTPSCAASR